MRGNMISKQAIDEYKKIYKQEFGEDISSEAALANATSFLRLIKTVYKPILKKNVKK